MNVVLRSTMHMSQVAQQTRGYPGFCNMKRLGVFLFPLRWDASPSHGYTTIKFAGIHLTTWVERGTVRVNCLAQEHNTVILAKARTQTRWSRDKQTNYEVTAPWITFWRMGVIKKNSTLITVEASYLSSLSCRISLLISCTCFAFSSTSSLSSFTWVLYRVCKGKALTQNEALAIKSLRNPKLNMKPWATVRSATCQTKYTLIKMSVMWNLLP